MRAFVKENLKELCQSIEELHLAILEEESYEVRIQYFQLCQESAIAIGEKMEKEIEKGRVIPERAIENLEAYYEYIFQLAQKENLDEADQEKANEYIYTVKAHLDELKETYHIVFFPYQAAMWDSLESIWKACADDPQLECSVVPIPYVRFDQEKNQWEACYEGALFPVDVPIIHYSQYSVAERGADVAFIHNPYDQYNRVTRVHSDYFSYELKKYVKKLIYVPYYVTTGYVDTNHHPLYQYMDYIVLQSEYAKSLYKGLPCYDKILPLGSPKLDAIITVCREGGAVPIEWAPILEGKKSVMLNTTIGTLLIYREKLIEKLQYVFEEVRNNKDVTLIWRPHPLLESTIAAMAPEIKDKFQKLKQYFVEHEIGILDHTSDISNTVAISDAYIGDDGSSVLNLFAVVGKPIFVLHHDIRRRISEAEKRRPIFVQYNQGSGKLYATPWASDTAFRIDENMEDIHLEDVNPNEVGIRRIDSWSDYELVMSEHQEEIREIEMPKGFETYPNLWGEQKANYTVLSFPHCYITIPAHANAMIRIDKHSHKARLFMPEILECEWLLHVKLSCFTATGTKLDENTVLIQRLADRKFIKIDVEQETYQVFEPRLTEDSYEKYKKKLVAKYQGFDKRNTKEVFCKRENEWFSLEDFLEDLSSGKLEAVRKPQIEVMSTIAANLDGSCGEKVHEFVRTLLGENQ